MTTILLLRTRCREAGGFQKSQFAPHTAILRAHFALDPRSKQSETEYAELPRAEGASFAL